MINKVYKNDTIENLKIFSDLEYHKEYSNKSKELNAMFNELTYPKFYDNLKNYINKLKSININSFYSLSSESKKNKNYNFKEFDISKIKSAIEKMKIKEKKLKEKRENPYTERCLYSNPIYTLIKDKIKMKKKEQTKLEKKDYNKKSNTPEIGRYNPLYDAISKHTQQVIFSLKNYEEYNKNLKTNTQYKKYNSRNINLNLDNEKNKTASFLNFEDKNNKTNYISKKSKDSNSKNKNNLNLNNNIFYNTAISKKNKRKIESRNINKNNHCLRFETYTARKPLVNKIFYKTENNFQIPSFCSPKNIKGSVTFNKVSSNKNSKNYFEKIINQKKDMPSLGFYRPNYSLVTNKTTNVFFDSRKNEKNNIKIMKLKKILGSYNVRGEYKLFNLLNNKNEYDLSKDNLD